MHHQVRAQRSLLGDDVQLLAEVAVLGEACELDQALEGELAPAAAHLRTAQRVDEVTGLARQQRLAAGEALDLHAQAREGIAPLAFQRLHLRLGALQGDAQRFDQLRDRDLALLERALGDHLIAPERLVRQAQEQLAVAAQGLARQSVEGGAQPRLGLLEQIQALGLLESLGLQPHLRGGELNAQFLDAACGADVRDERPEHQAGEEGGTGEVIQKVRDGDHRRKCAR